MIKYANEFRPIPNFLPIGFFGTFFFYIRLLFDLQVLSVYRHLKLFLKNKRGNLLDLGCGDSPYRFLINEKIITYFGLDIMEAEKFDYGRKNVTLFDGKNIPFEMGYFDLVICTEVLEHVEDYQILVNETYRVLNPVGQAIFTIPWSARYHYIPYDYFRFTPSTLKKIFSSFSDVVVIPRGTDITAISSKIVVFYFRNIFPKKQWRYLFSIFWIIASPVLLISLFLGHFSLIYKSGSDTDPIGYTVLLRK